MFKAFRAIITILRALTQYLQLLVWPMKIMSFIKSSRGMQAQDPEPGVS